ncbi:hypothetical protein ABTY61_26805 [Kitasatospora sp. NPDC096128]|uniref:hypothetical protein n=1 Tax=Kitasatospora sp. NPDC096128 TaxID=3155547 RepID=UPI00332F3146
MNNETTGLKGAVAAIGGTDLAVLVTDGNLAPFVLDIMAVTLSLATLFYAVALLVSALKGTAGE